MKRITTTEAAQNRRLGEAKHEGFQNGVAAAIKVLTENKMEAAAALLASLRKWLKYCDYRRSEGKDPPPHQKRNP